MANTATTSPPIHDLRSWLAQVEALGELLRIREPVDWNEELSGIVYLTAKAEGGRAPALLFENVRDHPGMAVLANIMGPSERRVALAMGLDPALPTMDLVRAARDALKKTIPPSVVPAAEASIDEVVWRGDDVDLTRLPAPKMWPLDGGRYLGTADVCITRHPDHRWLNLGTYRLMVHGPRELGFYVSPGKDAKLHREAWWQRGQACPIAVAIGCDPVLLAVAGWGFPKNRSEYDYAGGMRGRPIEVTPGLVHSDLLVPAHAEVVLEGVVRPGAIKPEGPFGEFTGYYGRPTADTPVIEVEAVRMRRRPILTAALMADYPACEHAVMVSILKSALIWDDLDKLGIPGIRGIYCHPAAAASYGMTVVSLEQLYAGHVSQVLSLVAQVSAGAYYAKWIIAVEEDVDPSDLNQVLWALSTRCNPVDDIDILRNTWSTWLDPTQNPPEKRPYGSKALINACREHRFKDRFAPRTRMRRRVYDAIVHKWGRLGLPGTPPSLPAFEADDAAFDPSVYHDLW